MVFWIYHDDVTTQKCFPHYWPFVLGRHRSLVDHTPLLWRHYGRDSVSNHQPHDCLLNRLFRHRSKKTSKLRVTGLCVGNSPGTGTSFWRNNYVFITLCVCRVLRGDKKSLQILKFNYHLYPAFPLSFIRYPSYWKSSFRFPLLSGEPDYFGRSKISSGGDLSHYSSASLY